MVVAKPIVFTICDAASIREGLLNVLASGINRLWRPEYPSHLLSTVAIQLEIESFDEGDGLYLEVEVLNADGAPSGIPTFEAVVADVLNDPSSVPFTVPFILDAEQLPIPSEGEYRMYLKINGSVVSDYLFSAGIREDLTTLEDSAA